MHPPDTTTTQAPAALSSDSKDPNHSATTIETNADYEAKRAAALPVFDEEEDRRRQEAKPIIGKRPVKAFSKDLAIWLSLTAYAIAVWVRGDGKDGVGFFTAVWVFITLRLLARHINMTKLLYRPIGGIWNNTVGRGAKLLPKWIIWGSLLIATLAALLIVAITTTSEISTRMERIQSFLGVLVLLAVATITSRKIRAISLQTVSMGVFFQFIIGLLVLKSEGGASAFRWFSGFVTGFLSYSHDGLTFLFGEVPKTNFAVNVLPAVIFFCAFISIVYYWGGMQYAVAKMGAIMMHLFDTSGAESIVAAASPFVGQVENALLVLPFIEYMTKSELHAIMTCGFATISGSVLLGYALIVGNSFFILTACLMSIPASLALTKLRYPEEEVSLTKGRVIVPKSEDEACNFLHAAGNGAATGAQLVILIAATLLAIVALFKAADGLVGWIFHTIDVYKAGDEGIDKGAGSHDHWISISYILRYPFYPIAWLLGVPGKDCLAAGEIIVQKIVVNEFVAYDLMDKAFKAAKILPRTQQILAFALCGFGNIGSVGIQVSALGALAPSRKKDLAQLAISAMLVGNMATWMTAAVAGCML